MSNRRPGKVGASFLLATFPAHQLTVMMVHVRVVKQQTTAALQGYNNSSSITHMSVLAGVLVPW